MFNTSSFIVIIILFSLLVFLLILYFLFWKLFFLRDPKRGIPTGDILVSPADGKIISIKHIDLRKTAGKKEISIKKGFGSIQSIYSEVSKKVIVVSIFMSLLNVHVNRAPCDGKVLSIIHTKGKFFNAADLKKSILNEKNEIMIKSKHGRIKVIQIAGALARRIECFISRDQEVVKGQRIGLINLGSQVTMIMPADKVNLLVRMNQRVTGGESVIASFLKKK